jgi:flagellar assembly protein FliH
LSKVIKGTEASDARAFEAIEVGEEAHEIVAEAKTRAAAILEEARAEGETLRAKAREEGFAEGKAAVDDRLEKQIAEEMRKARSGDVADLVKALNAMIREVNDYRGRLMLDSKQQLISLAIHIAETVIKREVASADDVAKLNLEEAIRLSAKRSRLLVRVSETDMKMLEDLLGDAPLVREEASAVELVPSAEILPGGCLVESAQGAVDARIDTQLREIEKVLLGEDADD